MQISQTSRTSRPQAAPDMRVCINCDLLQSIPALKPGFNARCTRCGSILLSKKSGAVNKSLALTTASLILFFPAVLSPLIRLKLFGESKSGSILSGIFELYNYGYYFISALVLLFAVLVPLLKFSSLFYTLLSLFLRKKLPMSFQFFKIYCRVKAFSMEEVFLMAALTALTKLDSIADYAVEPGFYFFTSLIIISVSAQSFITDSEIWERLENI
jgi:paraquat-inducible protein A